MWDAPVGPYTLNPKTLHPNSLNPLTPRRLNTESGAGGASQLWPCTELVRT